MTNEEKTKAYESLSDDLKHVGMGLSIMSDSWSRDISEILDAAIYHRDGKMVRELADELEAKVKARIHTARREGELAALPTQVLTELKDDMRNLRQGVYDWAAKAERMLDQAIKAQQK